ncbi:MAG: hypothetical protein ABSF77_01990 [Spirochaetia bacterium]|jgi:hypothetical protein
MNAKFVSLLTFFRGRRFYLLPLAAVSVLAAILFLIFPPEPLIPGEATGGGSVTTHGKSVAGTAAVTSSATKPKSTRYLTVNLGDTIDLYPGPVSFGPYPMLLSRIGSSWRYRARASGHTTFTVGRGGAKRQVYLFVSPLPARQVGREDVDWYRSQYGTGYANCGPALVSMAILWARGEDVPVAEIRAEIGYPYDDGSVSFDHLRGSLDRHDVATASPQLATPRDLMSIVDRGHVAFVLIQSGDIERTQDDPSTDLVGRYYDDDEGHYILVKGYTLDQRYYVVYDPYPVDWESNSLRYADDATMIGKNRFYAVQQLFDALKTRVVLEVSAN